MFGLTSSHRYFLYHASTDMRKSFDGLSGLVRGQLKCNPLSGDVFIFVNRRRNKVKLLKWEEGGFVLYYKRLESGTFEMPRWNNQTNTYQIRWSDLVMMIDGISMKNIRRRKRFSGFKIPQKE